jgi:hypothetical protein
MARSSQISAWVGWVWFAGIVILTVGFFNLISGLVAVFSSDSLVGVTDQGIVVLDVSTWGWIHLVLGSLLILTGFALLAGQTWARVVAIILVVLNAIAQFTTLQVTPWWSLVTIVLDIFVLWALIVHGEEAERAPL